jgi:hypothetical protein
MGGTLYTRCWRRVALTLLLGVHWRLWLHAGVCCVLQPAACSVTLYLLPSGVAYVVPD